MGFQNVHMARLAAATTQRVWTEPIVSSKTVRMMLIVVSLKTVVKENAVVSALEKTHKWTMVRQRNRVSQTRIVLKKIMGIVAMANAVTIAFATLHL